MGIFVAAQLSAERGVAVLSGLRASRLPRDAQEFRKPFKMSLKSFESSDSWPIGESKSRRHELTVMSSVFGHKHSNNAAYVSRSVLSDVNSIFFDSMFMMG